MTVEQPQSLAQQQKYDVPALPNGSVCIAGRGLPVVGTAKFSNMPMTSVKPDA